MKQRIKFSLILAMAISGFVFTACQDGDPGPAGAQGEKGDKGDPGDTGANGVGYDEITTYGNIVVHYVGTRPDNVAFDKTIDFKFCPTGAAVAYQHSHTWEWSEGSTGRSFEVQRFSSPKLVELSGSNNTVGFTLPVPDDTEEEVSMFVHNYTTIISDDMKYFALNLEGTYSPAETVTNYSFTSATGELKFKFHLALAADENVTGHALDITADVSVKVLEESGDF